MKRLATLSLAGFVLAILGCGGANGPEPFAANARESSPIPGGAVPTSPGASKSKPKPGVRRGLRRAAGPLSRPPSD